MEYPYLLKGIFPVSTYFGSTRWPEVVWLEEIFNLHVAKLIIIPTEKYSPIFSLLQRITLSWKSIMRMLPLLLIVQLSKSMNLHPIPCMLFHTSSSTKLEG
jgi:hypothetical protein